MDNLVQNPMQQPLAPTAGAAPTFDGIINNPLSNLQAPIPQTPEEAQSRKGQWSQLLEDPNLKGALLRMGLQMMQARPEREGLGATVGRSAIDAMDYYNAKTVMDSRLKQEEKTTDAQVRNADSQIGARTVATQGQQISNTAESAKLKEWETQTELRNKTAKVTYDRLVAQGKIDEAKALEAKIKTDEMSRTAEFIRQNPELARKVMVADFTKPIQEMNKTDAEIGLREAQIAGTYAGIEQDRARTGLQREELNARIQGLIGDKPDKTDDTSDFDGAADLVLAGYAEADKTRYPNVEKYITENFNTTLGKSLSGVMQAVKKKQAAGGGTTEVAPAKAAGQGQVGTIKKAGEGGWTVKRID